MKWFTREWHRGDLTDEEQDAVSANYLAHLDRIKGQLPSSLLHLSGITSRFSLHDGWFIHSYWTNTVTRDMVVDLAGWYHDRPLLHVRIAYRDAELLFPSQDIFDQIPRNSSTEILFQEVDLTDDGGFEHRLLLWPEEAGYFAVKFRNLDLTAVHFDAGTAEILDLN